MFVLKGQLLPSGDTTFLPTSRVLTTANMAFLLRLLSGTAQLVEALRYNSIPDSLTEIVH
jgi:hypothetical protein